MVPAPVFRFSKTRNDSIPVRGGGGGGAQNRKIPKLLGFSFFFKIPPQKLFFKTRILNMLEGNG